jgi:hypothetical protein
MRTVSLVAFLLLAGCSTLPPITTQEVTALAESDWRAIAQYEQTAAPKDGIHWYGEVYPDTPKSLMYFVGVKGTFWFPGEPRPVEKKMKKVEKRR